MENYINAGIQDESTVIMKYTKTNRPKDKKKITKAQCDTFAFLMCYDIYILQTKFVRTIKENLFSSLMTYSKNKSICW